jgi:hypothetical protein
MRSTSRSTLLRRVMNRTADPRRTPWPEHAALRPLIARGPEAPTLETFEARPRGTRKSGTRPCRLRAIVPQTGFSSADHCLRPIRYLQLEEDVRDVVSNRLQAHVQLPGYLLVALALRHEREDLLFASQPRRQDPTQAKAKLSLSDHCLGNRTAIASVRQLLGALALQREPTYQHGPSSRKRTKDSQF